MGGVDLAHLAMPLRCMSYDVEEYREQWMKMKDTHQQAKDLDPGAEFLSGIKHGEKFTPVVSTVLFSGKTWDGPLELYDMLDFGDEESVEFWKQHIPNYKINLVSISDFENPEVFKTSLRHVFGMAKCRSDRGMFKTYLAEHRDELEKMGTIVEEALIAILGETDRFMTVNENNPEKGEVRLCKAIDDMLEERRIEGKIEGENKFAQLAQILALNSRVEDLLKATTDYDYRNHLYGEYNIV